MSMNSAEETLQDRPTTEELRKQLMAGAGQEDGAEVDPQTEPRVTPAATEAAPPELIPGEPYQTADGWQVDIVEPYKQSFKAKTLKELIAKMATAQQHATRKIGELRKRTREAIKPEAESVEPKYEPKALTSEEQFIISQELQTNPTGAIAKLFKSTVGATPDEIREALLFSRRESARLKQIEEAQAFIAAHPDYVDSQENMRQMNDYLHKNKLAVTKANLELAFDELTEANLLQVKSTEEPVEVKSQPERIARPRKANVGLSPRAVSSTPEEDDAASQTRNVPTVDEFRRLPLDERRRIVRESMMRERGTRQ